MIKTCRVVLFLLLSLPAYSQKQGRQMRVQFIDTVQPVIFRGNYHIAAADKAAGISAFLKQHFHRELGTDNELSFTGSKTGPLATHYTFRQTYKGIAVYRSEVKVHLDRNSNIVLVTALLFDMGPLKAGKDAFKKIIPEPSASLVIKREELYFYDGEIAQPAILYVLKDPSDKSRPELILGEGGEILYHRDLRLYKTSEGKDSTVFGYIFDPDPLTSAKQYYAAPYVDSNDIAVVGIDMQRKQVSVKAWFDNDTFWLMNRYMRLQDFSGPYQGKMFSTQPEFYFSRSEKMFEAFNSFYHISKIQQYVDSRGFGALLDTVLVDPHALNNDDNSFFDYFDSIPTLAYGDGGVDDAEDADVIVHEFTHCMSYYAAPNTANGAQRLAIEEGNADYMAASNSIALDTFRYAEVYTWDGHNQYWDGRVTITPKLYTHLEGNAHLDGEIWSNALVLIMQRLGKGYSDSLMLNSLFFLSSNINMPAMAQTIVLLDSMMSGGKHYQGIYQSFVDKKILQWHVSVPENPDYGIKLLASAGFAAGNSEAEITFGRPFSGSLIVYDVQGRLISEVPLIQESSIKINPGVFAPGLYFVSLRNDSFQKTFKLLRY